MGAQTRDQSVLVANALCRTSVERQFVSSKEKIPFLGCDVDVEVKVRLRREVLTSCAPNREF